MAIVSASPPAVSARPAAALWAGEAAERPGPWVSGARRGRGVRPLTARFRATAGLVEDRESTERRSVPKKAAVLASVLGEAAGADWCASLSFADARTEEELLSCLRKEKESGRLSPIVASKMEEVYQNYRDAVVRSGNRQARDLIVSNMALAFDRVLADVKDPFQFPPYHKAVRKPFDYFKFGQDYIRPLVDFRTSYIGNIHLFSEMEEKLKKGHNVVLISNHQTEADPAVIALLLESTHPYIAEKLIYVAGDRVVTDPVCKPFSMGRNLICVNSKKHMNDDPNLIEKKKKENTQSLKEIATIFRKGSQILWIAPSGGRDRAEPSTGEWYPAPFDLSSVDIMRRVAGHSGVPGHIYPLALLCYEIMPPPTQVEKQIGEQRLISYHGVGLSVAPEIKYEQTVSGIDNPEQAKISYSEALYNSVVEQYSILNSAIYGRKGLDASTSTVSLSQPWK